MRLISYSHTARRGLTGITLLLGIVLLPRKAFGQG